MPNPPGDSPLTIDQAIHLAQHYVAARDYPQAEILLQQVLAQQPGHPEALNWLAIVAHEQERGEVALELLRQAIAAAPSIAGYHSNLGRVLRTQGKLHEAIASYRRAIALDAGSPVAHNNLGNALMDLGQYAEAIPCFRRAVALRPHYPEAHNNLGVALQNIGQLSEAEQWLRQAIALRTQYSEAHSNLGIVMQAQGRLDEAVALYRQAIALKPSSEAAHSNFLYIMHSHPAFDGKVILQEHRRWAEAHANRFAVDIEPHTNDPGTQRRLRVAYVSPDFLDHPVGRFLLPLFARHDPRHVEVVCYSDAKTEDHTTQVLRGHCAQWHRVVGMPDGDLAQRIRADQIDILVDLTLHANRNRMLVFARKPAPVQVTYLAYPGTSGLSTMDWRITDAYLDPPGASDDHYIEQSWRLTSYWCYQPPPDATAVVDLPAAKRGFVTFGCLNSFYKVSRASLAAWARLLQAVPRSRLLIHSHAGAHTGEARVVFAHQGVSADRVDFVPYQTRANYFQTYNRIDIALDPFPYCGGTTSCDALWMGVPLITLAGDIAVRRAGVSLLNQVGLGELVAYNVEQYLLLAAALAADPARLAWLRAGFRQRMANSPLMDSAGFARGLEQAYRGMWHIWCAASQRRCKP